MTVGKLSVAMRGCRGEGKIIKVRRGMKGQSKTGESSEDDGL